MLPPELKLEVIDQTKEQFRIIKSLVERADIASLIIATDAGREGELVARWIIEESGYRARSSACGSAARRKRRFKPDSPT